VDNKKTGLDLMRTAFPDNQIGKLPKGSKAQNDCPANEKVNCKVCGGWHHPKIVHLDYVGHAALTDRLLDADPLWSWKPLAFKDGLPLFDNTGGLWIELTICGHTRIGYGNAAPSNFKEVGSREKEVIGDALRNAAMRFGAALDLWHKGELHVEDPAIKQAEILAAEEEAKLKLADLVDFHSMEIDKCTTTEELKKAWMATPKHIQPIVTRLKDAKKAELTPVENENATA